MGLTGFGDARKSFDSDNPDVRHISVAMQVGELEPTNSERIYAMAHVLSDRNRCGLGGESWHLPPYTTGQITCIVRHLHSDMKFHQRWRCWRDGHIGFTRFTGTTLPLKKDRTYAAR